MRKLASIQKILDIKAIEGADKIELAIINNWQVVVTKDTNHKIGDLVIYCEIDSFLPTKPEFEFLRKYSFKKMGDLEGFRLKTVKLKGVVSSGLIFPLSILESITNDSIKEVDGIKYLREVILNEGLDVSDLLGIVKYEPPIPAELAGVAKGAFPSFIPKTDEERCQNFSKEYSDLLESQTKFYITEKLDGTSATYYINNGVFGVCSRNLELIEIDTNTLWKVARQLDLENKLKSIGKNVSVQGELIGEGIQGNPYKLRGQVVKFFNLFDIDGFKYYPIQDMISTLNELGLEHVPILDMDFKLPKSIDELLEIADGVSVLNDRTIREGLVIRSHDRKISFKAISNKFLLNEK